MKEKMKLVVIFIIFFLITSNIFPNTIVFNSKEENKDYEVEVLILTYKNDIDNSKIQEILQEEMKKHNSKHGIIMPESMTPIAIPKKDFDKAKEIFKDSLISLNNLNCENQKCLD